MKSWLGSIDWSAKSGWPASIPRADVGRQVRRVDCADARGAAAGPGRDVERPVRVAPAALGAVDARRQRHRRGAGERPPELAGLDERGRARRHVHEPLGERERGEAVGGVAAGRERHRVAGEDLASAVEGRQRARLVRAEDEGVELGAVVHPKGEKPAANWRPVRVMAPAASVISRTRPIWNTPTHSVAVRSL